MDAPNNQTRERILEVADELFSKRGYASVTLRDIAGALGMKHASLYYYVPGGKKQLYIEVMERNFSRHRDGLTAAIAGAGDHLRDQMVAVSQWLVTQPPIDFSRMHEADMSELTEEQSERLMAMAYNAMRIPIAAALTRARDAGQINLTDLNLAAMALVSLVQSVHTIPQAYRKGMDEKIGVHLVDMMLQGWMKR